MKFDDTLISLTRQALEIGATPALLGPPGIGKSSWTQSLAYAMGTKAFVLPVNQLAAKEDLTGGRLVPYTKDDGSTAHKQVFYPHHVIQEAIDYAIANPREWPILFLDEINRTTADVTSGALTLVTLRKMGHVELPDNLRLMIAGNDKGNVVALDDASLSRFVLIHVEPDAGTLMNILGDRMNPWVKKVLTQFPDLIFEKSAAKAIMADGFDDDDDNSVRAESLFDAGEEMSQLTTPRTIEHISNWLNLVDRDDLNKLMSVMTTVEGREINQLAEIIEGFVGDTGFSTQLMSTIVEDLSSGSSSSSSSNRIVVPKPNCYTDLKSAGTVSELAEKIEDLTDNERSGSLLFALSEKVDNTRLVEQLAIGLDQLESDHLRTMVQLVTSSQIERANFEVFLDSGSPVAQNAKAVLSSFL